GVIARLGAVFSQAVEARTGVLIAGPTFGAVIAGRLGTVQRRLALASIEADEMAARRRAPQHTVPVDVAAADTERRHRHVVDFGQPGLRVEAGETRGRAEHADRVPDAAVGRV